MGRVFGQIVFLAHQILPSQYLGFAFSDALVIRRNDFRQAQHALFKVLQQRSEGQGAYVSLIGFHHYISRKWFFIGKCRL